MRKSSARPGFTLIELLVVVAIIGLLIAILLPSLARAREQGRIAVCLTNLRSISGASHMYLTEDTSGDLPWAVPFVYKVDDKTYDSNYVSEFIWGGGMPQRTSDECLQALGYTLVGGDVYNIPPRHRPMNKYVVPGVSWDNADRETEDDRKSKPNQMPAVFKCPSDKSPWVPTVGKPNPIKIDTDSVFATWDFWGSSYPINWYWPYYYNKCAGAPPGNQPPYSKAFGKIMGFAVGPSGTPSPKGLGKYMLNRSYGGWESRFVVFYENLFNYASEGARPKLGECSTLGGPTGKKYRGWHGNPDFHVAAMKDGHAEYKRRDTTDVEGPGWTTWPSRPWEGEWEDD